MPPTTRSARSTLPRVRIPIAPAESDGRPSDAVTDQDWFRRVSEPSWRHAFVLVGAFGGAFTDVIRRIRTRVFRTVSIVVGLPLGVGFALMGSGLGTIPTLLLYPAAVVAYGSVPAVLGWRGYLPLPEDLET